LSKHNVSARESTSVITWFVPTLFLELESNLALTSWLQVEPHEHPLSKTNGFTNAVVLKNLRQAWKGLSPCHIYSWARYEIKVTWKIWGSHSSVPKDPSFLGVTPYRLLTDVSNDHTAFIFGHKLTIPHAVTSQEYVFNFTQLLITRHTTNPWLNQSWVRINETKTSPILNTAIFLERLVRTVCVLAPTPSWSTACGRKQCQTKITDWHCLVQPWLTHLDSRVMYLLVLHILQAQFGSCVHCWQSVLLRRCQQPALQWVATTCVRGRIRNERLRPNQSTMRKATKPLGQVFWPRCEFAPPPKQKSDYHTILPGAINMSFRYQCFTRRFGSWIHSCLQGTA
jgi:hypothetical protein